MPPHRADRRRWRTTAVLALCMPLFFACSSDPNSSLPSVELPEEPVPEEPAPEEPAPEEPAPEEPAPEEPAPEEPAPEEPAPEEPAPEAPPADETEGEPLTSEEWVVLILLGLLALAAVVGITALLTRGRKHQTSYATSNQVRLDDITRSCRSVHDSAVLSVLQASDPVALRNGWAAAQQQLVSLESRISYLAADLTDAGELRAVQELGASVTGVRGALESNVGLRLDESGTDQAQLIEASNRTVVYRSEELETSLQRVLPLRL